MWVNMKYQGLECSRSAQNKPEHSRQWSWEWVMMDMMDDVTGAGTRPGLWPNMDMVGVSVTNILVPTHLFSLLSPFLVLTGPDPCLSHDDLNIVIVLTKLF